MALRRASPFASAFAFELASPVAVRLACLLAVSAPVVSLSGCGGASGTLYFDLSVPCGDEGCPECETDVQCARPNPRCDKNAGKCVPCLPSADNCPLGQRCVAHSGSYACASSCRSSAECPRTDGGTQTECCNMACIDTSSEASHCGACNMACPKLPNAAGACLGGTCRVGACTAGFADCNQTVGDGCEVDTNGDARNCGSCGRTCPPARNAGGACMAGHCVLMCNPGFLHCSMIPEDGCEVNGAVDANNCGACGNACPGTAPHGTVGCVNGSCGIVACDAGWGDCNKMLGDGCEKELVADAANCGACGNTCNLPNATAACAGGRCVLSMCKVGFADCDALPQNGCEAPVDADIRNCGACSRACSAPRGTPACVGGVCSIAACDAGFADCNMMANDGCEASVATDTKNCGGCGKACPQPANAVAVCANGTCGVGPCNFGFADCDKSPMNGCEADLTSVMTCGSCNVACPNVQNGVPGCKAGVCGVGMCNALFGDCNGNPADGCEKALAIDVLNCGGCGKVCAPPNANPTCLNGVCGFLSCKAGFGDCNGNPADGCEKNLTNDAANCGACGKACGGQTPNCVGGVCAAGCAGAVGASIGAVLVPSSQFGFCWYLGVAGRSCDTVCAAAGGTNQALGALNAFADDCNGGGANQPATWFFQNANAGNWSYASGVATGYRTLGHGYSGFQYYGKCAIGADTTVGLLPGSTNSDATRALVCACSK